MSRFVVVVEQTVMVRRLIGRDEASAKIYESQLAWKGQRLSPRRRHGHLLDLHRPFCKILKQTPNDASLEISRYLPPSGPELLR